MSIVVHTNDPFAARLQDYLKDPATGDTLRWEIAEDLDCITIETQTGTVYGLAIYDGNGEIEASDHLSEEAAMAHQFIDRLRANDCPWNYQVEMPGVLKIDTGLRNLQIVLHWVANINEYAIQMPKAA